MKMFWPMRLTVLVCGVFGLMSCANQGNSADKQAQMQATQKDQAHAVGVQSAAIVPVQGRGVNAPEQGQSNGAVAAKNTVTVENKTVLARIKATLMQYRVLSGMAVFTAGAGLYFFNKGDAKQNNSAERQKGSVVSQNGGQKSKAGNNKSEVVLNRTSRARGALGELADSGQETKLGKKSMHTQSSSAIQLIAQESDNSEANGLVGSKKEADQALRDAVARRDPNLVKAALDNGADMYQVMDEVTGCTLFMEAVRKGRQALVEEFLKKERELNKGSKDKSKKQLLHITDKQGRTPLMYLCDGESDDSSANKIDKLSVLMRYGADIDAQDNNGCTGLLLAIKNIEKIATDQRGRDIVKELRLHGANIYLADKEGVTTLMWAVRKKSGLVIDLLCDYRLQVDAQGKRSLVAIVNQEERATCKHPRIDQELRQFVNALDKKNRTALMDAIDADDESIIQDLIFRGAAEQVPGCCEPNMAQYAIVNDRVKALPPLMGICGGIGFKKDGKKQAELLRFAVDQENEHEQVVKLLYNQAVNINFRGCNDLSEEWGNPKEGSDPVEGGDSAGFHDNFLGIACGRGHVNTVKVLLGQSEQDHNLTYIGVNLYTEKRVQEYAGTQCAQENEELKQVFDVALKQIEADKKKAREQAKLDAWLASPSS